MYVETSKGGGDVVKMVSTKALLTTLHSSDCICNLFMFASIAVS